MGKGHFGEVYTASVSGVAGREGEIPVAVKLLKSGHSLNSLAMKQFASEMEIMASIGRHLNIVSLLGIFVKGIKLLPDIYSQSKCACGAGEPILILEYCQLGSLRHFLQKARGAV